MCVRILYMIFLSNLAQEYINNIYKTDSFQYTIIYIITQCNIISYLLQK